MTAKTKSTLSARSPTPAATRSGRTFFQRKTEGAAASPFFHHAPAGESLQNKLVTGRPGDAFEREADVFAEAVVGNTSPAPAGPALAERATPLRRAGTQAKAEGAGGLRPRIAEEEKVQAKKDEERPLQAKAKDEPLQAGAEEEKRIQAKAEGSQVRAADDEKDPVQARLEDEWIRPGAATEKSAQDEDEPKAPVQARADGTGAEPAVVSVHETLQAEQGRGVPLPADLHRQLARMFGADFGAVRIHTDGNAVHLAQEVHAQAFTRGNDIYFNAGRYDPGSTQGRRLLAHELTHTIQQGTSQPAAGEPPAPEQPQAPPLESTTAGGPAVTAAGPAANPPDNRPAAPPLPGVSAAAPEFAAGPGPTGPGVPPRAAATGATEAIPTAGVPGGPAAAMAATPSEAGVEPPASAAVPPEGVTAPPEEVAAPPEGVAAPPEGVAAPPEGVAAPPEGVAAPPEGVAGAEGAVAPAVIERAPASPGDDPAFQETIRQVGATRRTQRAHKKPEIKKGEVVSAERLPEDAQSTQNDQQEHLVVIDETAQATVREAKPFTPETFRALLKENLQEIENKLPHDEDAADRFKSEKPLEQVKENIGRQVTNEGKKVGDPIVGEAQNPPPDSNLPVEAPKDLKEEPSGKAPRPIDPAAAAPKPKTDAEISMEAESRSLDEQMAGQRLTEEQLAESNEPQFLQALDTKRQAQVEAEAVPARYRDQEQGMLAKASAQAGRAGRQGFGGMFDTRQGVFGAVFTDQAAKTDVGKENLALVHQTLADEYKSTKDRVVEILEQLTTTVNDTFTEQADAAKKTFEKKVEDQLDDIYGITRIDDWIFGEDTEAIEKVFRDEKQRFLEAMDRTLDEIARVIAEKLNAAVDRVKEGRRRSEDLVSHLSEAQQKQAKDALSFYMTQYDTLEESVHDKERELASSLAESYKSNVDALRESFDKIKSEVSKGWIGKAAEFISDVASAIAKLADLLWSVLSRLANLIGDIIRHPIRFLENLGAGIAAGVDTFIGNIGTELATGFFDWLTGAVGGAGITLPDKFDARGLFSLAAQVVGLSWETFRELAVNKFGRKVVEVLEKGSEVAGKGLELFRIARKEGLGALWEHVKEMIASNVDEIYEKAKEAVLFEAVKKALEFVASLFTPAGAFIKAVQLLYRALKFLVDNIDRIRELVNAFMDSLELAVAGQVDLIKQKVILALRRLLVLAIDALAKLLGLGNLGEKVRTVLKAIRSPIIRAMSWFLDRLKPLVMRVAKTVEKAVGKVKAKVMQVIQWWKQSERFVSSDGGTHRVFFRGAGAGAQLVVASQEEAVKTFLSRKATKSKDAAEKKAINVSIKAFGKVEDSEDKLTNLEAKKQAAKSEPVKDRANKDIKSESGRLRGHVLAFSQTLSKLSFAEESDLLTKTEIGYGSESGSKYVEANPLTYLPGQYVGSPPKEDPAGWDHAVKLDTDPNTGKRRNNWVRGHLLNENLHGPGLAWNLVPITQKINSEMKGSAEAEAKEAVATKGNMVYYRTDVTFHGGAPPISDFPAQILVKWHYLERQQGAKPPKFKAKEGTKRNRHKFTMVAPPATAAEVQYNLNDIGRDTLVKVTGISHRFGLLIQAELRRRGRFESYRSFAERMARYQSRNMENQALFDEHLANIRTANKKGAIVF